MKKFLLLEVTMAMLACLAGRAASAGDPLDHWQQLNADAAPLPTQAIGYGQGKFLGLNNQHELLASTNALQWTVTKTFLSNEFPNALAFADGLWVLGGNILDGGVFLLTSAD